MGGCLGTQSPSLLDLNETEDNEEYTTENEEYTTENEGVFEINIGEDFAHKLHEIFGEKNVTLPKGFRPIIKIPEEIGRELYEAYLESIDRQVNSFRKGKEFARNQQEAECSQTGETSGAQDCSEPLQSAAYYRKEAQRYLKTRTELYNQANYQLQSNNKHLAREYFQQAKQITKLYEQANSSAAAAFLEENKKNFYSKNTIDLHHLYVKEAIAALDVFLNEKIYDLRNKNKVKTKTLIVITGRGKHSPNGIPKVKPAVIKRLQERKLRYIESNPGQITVSIFKSSYLTEDLRDESRLRY